MMEGVRVVLALERRRDQAVAKSEEGVSGKEEWRVVSHAQEGSYV